jgi:hypothetical protein
MAAVTPVSVSLLESYFAQAMQIKVPRRLVSDRALEVSRVCMDC